MLVNCCDICQKKIGQGMNFCERCAPFGEEYAKEIGRIAQETIAEGQRKVEKFRNSFLQTRVVPATKQANLKAV